MDGTYDADFTDTEGQLYTSSHHPSAVNPSHRVIGLNVVNVLSMK